MTTAADFLKEARRLGCEVLTAGDRVGLRGPQEAVEQLTPHLGRLKAELLALLTRPRLDDYGDLSIPIDTPPALCWWRGGASIGEVLDTLDATEDARRRYECTH
ncbi:MAG: hypothetical protein P1P84_01380 [Deferrisomatales bacterium]|nr:hypothetical protein [Deferrisomatales bacterium]